MWCLCLSVSVKENSFWMFYFSEVHYYLSTAMKCNCIQYLFRVIGILLAVNWVKGNWKSAEGPFWSNWMMINKLYQIYVYSMIYSLIQTRDCILSSVEITLGFNYITGKKKVHLSIVIVDFIKAKEIENNFWFCIKNHIFIRS